MGNVYRSTSFIGLGGLIAVVGGFLFLLVCYWAVLKK